MPIKRPVETRKRRTATNYQPRQNKAATGQIEGKNEGGKRQAENPQQPPRQARERSRRGLYPKKMGVLHKPHPPGAEKIKRFTPSGDKKIKRFNTGEKISPPRGIEK